MGKAIQKEVPPRLPASGQILGFLVRSLNLDDHRLHSKAAQRFFTGHRVKQSTRAEIIDGFADALAAMGFNLNDGREETSRTPVLAEAIDWHATHWDRLRTVLLPRMSRVYPSHLPVVWKTYVRLAAIDLAFRVASHLRLTDRPTTTLEILNSASVCRRGAYLNRKRQCADISLLDFADEVGVTENAVEGWLYGGARPRDENLAKIATALSSGIEQFADEDILRELRLLYWVSDIAETMSKHLGSDAVKEIIVQFHEYASLIHDEISDAGQNCLSMNAVAELAARGTRSPVAKTFLAQLVDRETDPEWKKDLSAAGSDWIGRVLSVNYQVHRSEEIALIEQTDGQILENWGISDPEAYEHYLNGRELFDAGQMREALAELTKAVELDPLDPANHFALGSVKGGIGSATADRNLVDEALEACWMAVALDRNWIAPWTEIGWLLLISDKPHEAVEHLRSVRPQCRPLDARYYHALGLALGLIGERAESLAALESSLEIDQNDPRVAIDAALTAFQVGDKLKTNEYRKMARHLGVSDELDRSIALAKIDQTDKPIIAVAMLDEQRLSALDVAIARRPNDVKAYLARAKIHFKRRDDEQALSDFDVVLRLDPDRLGVLVLRGVVYVYTGRYESAIADLSEAIRHNAGVEIAHYHRGLAYGEIDDLDRAIDDFSETVRLRPEHSDAYRARGDCLRYKNEFDLAISDYSVSITLDPLNAVSFRGRGSAHRLKNDFDSAIDDFDVAISLDSEDPVAYRFRGDALLAQGAYDEAISDFDAALKLDPEDEVAYRWRGTAHLCMGDLNSALSDFDAAITRNPENAYTHQCRGLVREAMDDPEGAQIDFLRARELGYDEPN